ncbi:MAG TPA: Tad domain-containing protein, partial [Allosphingosinicella sp.]
MRALSRLKDLISSERGNVLVVAAAVMPLLLASAAFAVDTIQLSIWKRQLQRAADSGAIAGAYALAQRVDIHAAVEEDLAANSFPPLTEEEVVTPGERLGFKRAVRVQLKAAQELPFMSIFTSRSANLTADATAAITDGGTYCMIALDDDDKKPGIVVGGNSVVNLKCGMKTNARGSNSIDGNGSKTQIIAEPVASAGGLVPGNFPPGTTLQPNAQPQRDPLAWLPNPTVPTGCNSGTLSVGSGQTLTLSDTEICYQSYDIQGTLNLTGTNVVMTANGGDISVQGTLSGSSVTVVMTSATGAAGDVKVTSADATLDLAAPTSGLYDGLLFYRDRRAGYADIKITGNASLKLSGALYFPTADLSVSGNSGSS